MKPSRPGTPAVNVVVPTAASALPAAGLGVPAPLPTTAAAATAAAAAAATRLPEPRRRRLRALFAEIEREVADLAAENAELSARLRAAETALAQAGPRAGAPLHPPSSFSSSAYVAGAPTAAGAASAMNNGAATVAAVGTLSMDGGSSFASSDGNNLA
jgi:hypothetical protein